MINYFNRNRWWAIAFVALLVMNAASLGALWLMKDRPPHPANPGGRPEVASFLVKELGFDAVQKEKLLQLRTAHQQKVNELRAKTRDAKDALFALLQQPQLSDSDLEKAVYAASENDRQMDLVTFRHFQQIRSICTPAQKPKFDALIKEIIRLMAPPMPDRHMGPPAGGRPEGMPGDGPPPGEQQGEHRPPPPQQ